MHAGMEGASKGELDTDIIILVDRSTGGQPNCMYAITVGCGVAWCSSPEQEMEEVAAAPSEASFAQVTVVASPVYPRAHFTVQLESVKVLSEMPSVQASVSPPNTPVPKVYAAQECST